MHQNVTHNNNRIGQCALQIYYQYGVSHLDMPLGVCVQFGTLHNSDKSSPRRLNFVNVVEHLSTN
jgi:hypothetical protein